jgi:hypothetical protein
VVLLVLSSNLPLHSAFIFGVDWTQTTKSPRTDEPDAYSALQVGQTNAQEAVTCRRARTALFRHAPFHRLRLLYVRGQYGTLPCGTDSRQPDETSHV